jgi:membrane-associated phospholipid phosphatase
MPSKMLLRIAFGGAIATGLAHFFDFHIESFSGLKNIKNSDLIQLFRGWGFLGTWVLIAITARLLAKPDRTGAMTGWRRHLYRKEWLLFASPLLSGGAAEVGKLIIRRLRPHGEFFYLYRSWLTDPFRSSGLGFPSSHTAVAFGGSTILLLQFPKLQIPAVVMAVGCMTTRVFSGAHYFSDGVGGALVGVISSVLCIKIYLYLNKVSRRNGTAILNSEPSLVYKKRPEWKPVIERGQVAYELQVSDNVQASNGVQVSGNLQAADRARVSTRP